MLLRIIKKWVNDFVTGVNKIAKFRLCLMFFFVIYFKSYLERPLRENVFCNRNLGFIGRFKNGNPVGDFWLRMHGGGFVTGNFATQETMAFIYPGLTIAREIYGFNRPYGAF
jgi:hypothetical protein